MRSVALESVMLPLPSAHGERRPPRSRSTADPDSQNGAFEVKAPASLHSAADIIKRIRTVEDQLERLRRGGSRRCHGACRAETDDGNENHEHRRLSQVL